MNKVDRPAVMELAQGDTTTSLGITTYLSAIAMSKLDKTTGYPTIEKYTTYKLYKNMEDKMPHINESSVRLGVKRLLEQGLFEYIDGDLAILNSGVGHIKSDENFKSKGYITLHHFFFSKVFFNLSLRAQKLALILVCRLNNSGVKTVNLNFKSKKNPESFEYFCRVLKINRFAHIKHILKELKPLFNIAVLEHNTVQFSLNNLSKAVVTGADKLFNFTQEQLSKTEKMLKEANKKNLAFNPNQVKEICEAVCNYSMKLGRKVLKELCKCKRPNIKNLFGYTRSILSRLESETT